MIVAVSLLAISLSLLIYHHPPSTWTSLFLPQVDDKRPASPPSNITPADDDTKEPTTVDNERRPDTLVPPDVKSETKSSPDTTPKAVASDPPNGEPVPTFTLAGHETSDDEDDEEDLPPPSFPALNSAQRASRPNVALAHPSAPTLMAPPAKPTATSSLMPPPSLKASNLRALPTNSQSSSLRIPTTGPLPNRGPVPNRNPSSSLGVASFSSLSNSSIKPPNARNKVQLTPGHSPLDWANLQRSGTNLSGVSSLQRVTPSMLKHNNGRKGKPAWSSYQGKVYNITPYLPFHPGGEGELRRVAGKDGAKLFMEVHPWVNWDNMLGECVVGVMVSEEQAPANVTSSLEEMD
ncbi:hypothetical protein BU24DRAFT_417735 [Aaosphaeria arxii CBS 175.79]|uniref:Cytochrome b5 heme-binding domain-containing protein n=1 Tax=Aaosphaeria arxii CBS 175.79 TaxID=1450172 RepID=A0A6A5YBU1_9PLEO|nr:uncharacterized protein BU24DRAFT_417735 [Aaosphaeria arxii CBS 175.79]KAF2022084.1 hypothetical protein BU24DRAFT_417735 [Aaosphaeria arxii CBS 175.79]